MMENEESVDEYMTNNAYDSWLIPSEYQGEIVYSQKYVKGFVS
jgi:hypothetical protein